MVRDMYPDDRPGESIICDDAKFDKWYQRYNAEQELKAAKNKKKIAVDDEGYYEHVTKFKG